MKQYRIVTKTNMWWSEEHVYDDLEKAEYYKRGHENRTPEYEFVIQEREVSEWSDVI